VAFGVNAGAISCLTLAEQSEYFSAFRPL